MKSPYRAILHLFFLVILLTACGPVAITPVATSAALLPTSLAPAPVETTSPLAEYFIPPYYAPEYISVVEDSKKESGLVIYSIMAANNWAPILEVFNAHYPWIKVTTFDLGAEEVFTRYDEEVKSATRTADMVISSDQIGWQVFLIKGDNLTYRSQEDLFLPEWSKPTIGISHFTTGLYTVSSDPMVIIYNKMLVGDPPSSMQDLGRIVLRTPDEYKNQIVTYDADLNATGFGTNWFWINRTGDEGWKSLTAVGQSAPRLMTSGGAMVDAVGKGEAKLGYFVSAITVFPKLAEYPNLGWNYITDGQPILLRNMAVTRSAASPNSAKLMLDFILSQEGQLALEKGGLTPYRTDIFGIPAHHLSLIAQRVGDKNLVLFSMDDRIMDKAHRQVFIIRWRGAVQKAEPTPTPTPEPSATPAPSPTP